MRDGLLRALYTLAGFFQTVSDKMSSVSFPGFTYDGALQSA